MTITRSMLLTGLTRFSGLTGYILLILFILKIMSQITIELLQIRFLLSNLDTLFPLLIQIAELHHRPNTNEQTQLIHRRRDCDCLPPTIDLAGPRITPSLP